MLGMKLGVPPCRATKELLVNLDAPKCMKVILLKLSISSMQYCILFCPTTMVNINHDDAAHLLTKIRNRFLKEYFSKKLHKTRSSYVVCRSMFGVQPLPFGVRRSAFGVRRLAFGVRCSADLMIRKLFRASVTD